MNPVEWGLHRGRQHQDDEDTQELDIKDFTKNVVKSDFWKGFTETGSCFRIEKPGKIGFGVSLNVFAETWIVLKSLLFVFVSRQKFCVALLQKWKKLQKRWGHGYTLISRTLVNWLLKNVIISKQMKFHQKNRVVHKPVPRNVQETLV